jgi:prepilin peptidase CpaA
MIEAVLSLIALVLVTAGAYTDIKTREVPDWMNFSGIVAGIVVRALWSIDTGDWRVLGWGALGFIVFFALAVVMYYAGQWGGGDSKLLMAMGALLGLEFSLKSAGLTFLVWLLLAGAGYGLVWSIVLAVKNWKSFKSSLALLSKQVKWAHLPVLGVFLLGLAFAIATDDEILRITMLIVALVVPVLLYTSLAIKAVEKCCMYRMLPTGKLTEGDWIAKQVRFKGRYICGPKDLGITKEKINELKRLKIKQVLVKEGMPFVPSFLIAFLLALLLGNPIGWFI